MMSWKNVVMLNISIQKKLRLQLYLIIASLAFVYPSFSMAQIDASDVKNEAATQQQQELPVSDTVTKDSAQENKPAFKQPTFAVGRMQSLFFTFWQHQAILDAKKTRNSGGVVRAPSGAELDNNEVENAAKIRDLSLSGIVYRKKDDWVIWLNGQRVTPTAVPKEVLDLKVFSDYIEVKWMDEFSNKVFPVRLRPHQRFNLDARIYLPG